MRKLHIAILGVLLSIMLVAPVIAGSSINLYGPGATSSSPTFDKITFSTQNCAGTVGNQLCVDGAGLHYFVNSVVHWESIQGVGGINSQFPITAAGFTSSNATSTTIGTNSTFNISSGSSIRMGASANQFLFQNTAPTIGSGFGTSPSVATSNGSAAFTVNVGTGGVASSGVITMPATATNGWKCDCIDEAANAAHEGKQTVSTGSSATTCTVEHQTTSTGAATAWTASRILSCMAMGR